jgi:acetyltransferase-like isoleucine patch superfamily enzyme
MIGYYTSDELNNLGFAHVGQNVRISRSATLYNLDKIKIGNDVRIDNFCILAPSGNASLCIGNNVHISAFCFINGMGNVMLEDYVTLAPRVSIFSSSDDYSGVAMTGATLPSAYLGTETADVILCQHTIVGVAVSILPGVTLAEGTAVAAHSLINKSTEPFIIVGGVPARKLRERERNMLILEKKYRDETTR